MNNYKLISDTFNPKIYYLSYEYYDSTNLLPYHFHPFPVITFVEDITGMCTYKIQNDTYDIKKGDLIMINPGVYHYKLIQDDSRIEELHLALDEINLVGYPLNYIIYPETHIVLRPDNCEPELRRCLEEFFEADKFQKPLYDVYIKALSMKLFILAMSCCSKNKNENADKMFHFNRNSKYEAVSDLRDYLLENYRENILLSVMASKMYMSEEYLSHLFKSEIGQSPISYLIDIRLNKAKNLLEESTLSIVEIAKYVGYNDAYYFSKLFKKHFSISPLNYRKQFKS